MHGYDCKYIETLIIRQTKCERDCEQTKEVEQHNGVKEIRILANTGNFLHLS